MNKRMRRVALAIILLLTCLGSAWSFGGKEDPLLYADRLIAEQKYDEAIVYLTDFIKNNPNRFDAAQARMRKITKIRSAYNQSAATLIEVLKNDPTNQEKKLAMIRELETYERVPNPAVLEFVAKTKDLALFTYNRAKFEEIMNKGRALIDSGSFVEAARTYESGFVLYRPEFLEAGWNQDLVAEAFERVASVSASIGTYEPQGAELKAAFLALSDAYAGGNLDLIAPAWERARSAAIVAAGTRRFVVDLGRKLEETFDLLSAKNETVTENSFLPFAFRLILGRRSEGRLEGIAGAIDAQWTGSLGLAQNALDKALTASMEAAREAYDRGDWAAARSGFAAAAYYADSGVALVSLWSHYVPSDLIQRSTTLGQAALELKGQDYLRLEHAGTTARAYTVLTALRERVQRESDLLGAYQAPAGQLAIAGAFFEARRATFVEAQKDINALKASSGALAERLAGWTRAGYGSDSARAEQGALDGRISDASNRARAMETLAVASDSAYRFGLLAAASEQAAQAITTGRDLLAGLPSDDPLLPDAIFRYPTRALASLSAASTTLTVLRTDTAAFLASLRVHPAYVTTDTLVRQWSEKAEALATVTAAAIADAANLSARATEQRVLAESSRLEAERRIAESRNALKLNNFENARERLERARERYLASLALEQNALLRTESDKSLSDLAAAILKTENDLVVSETRKLVTTGKNQYMQGEFDRAESTLLQARARWRTTNSTPEIEVEYWLKLVQTALSVKTGRDIPVTAPLFPEMSQLLSLAKQYYEDGAAKLAKRDRTGAIKAFTQARQKISEIKVVFPLNQEARVLELRIDQLSDPDEFGRSFIRLFNEAKAKIDARIDLTTAYSDLLDLEAINPRYPGLRAQIERAEILLGFRQPPPDLKALAEARSLVQAAQKIFDSGQVAQFAFARAQLEKALGLDPNNEQAGALKDRIATYIGGDTAIVLSSAAETLYNEAVTYFTNGDYLNARARLTRLVAVFPRGQSMQKVADLDARLAARGY